MESISYWALFFSAAQTTNFFRRNRSVSAWLDRVMGTVLIGLGIRLALLDNANG